MNLNIKNLNVKEVVLWGLLIINISLSGYLFYQFYDAEDYLDTLETKIENVKLNNNNNIDNREIQVLKNNISKLNNEINQLKQTVFILEKQLHQKIKIKRDNIFFSEEIKNILKHINVSKNSKNVNRNNKNMLKNFNLKAEKKKEKKEVKKNLKFNINPPSIIYVSRIDNINNNIVLYTQDGQILSKDYIYDNDFKVIKISTKDSYVILKNINKNTYQFGKTYKVPYIIKIGNLDNPIMQPQQRQKNNTGTLTLQ